jgi:hypothetical protein
VLQIQPLGQVHDPLAGEDPLWQVRQSLARGPLQVLQLVSQLVHWNLVSVLLTKLLAGQVHAPFNASLLPGHLRHWFARKPEQVKHVEWQLEHWNWNLVLVLLTN